MSTKDTADDGSGRKLVGTSTHNGDDASPDDPRPSPSLSLCTIEHIARNQQSELLPAHASGEARLVVKESPKERTISTYKHIIHPSLDFNPRLSRPSFYPPIDYSLTADQNTRRDFISLYSRTVMGDRCPLQRQLRWGENKFEEWGTPTKPFDFICHVRYIEVDLEYRVPGIFPGRHLWYTGLASKGLNFLTIGHLLARSTTEVVYVVASHQRGSDAATIARYGLLRVSGAMLLRSWLNILAGAPLQRDFNDGDLSRWEIAREAGPEIVLCARFPPHIPHTHYYIADLVRPYLDDF